MICFSLMCRYVKYLYKSDSQRISLFGGKCCGFWNRERKEKEIKAWQREG
jgi:hypothetical protein